MNESLFLEHLDNEFMEAYKELEKLDLKYENLLETRKKEYDFYKMISPEIIENSDIKFSVETINGQGKNTIELRIYEPKARKNNMMPTILYFHGGGCVLGNAINDDDVCVRYATEFNCAVVNVEYRLAPEYPAPAGQLDAISAWKWVCEEGSEAFNLDINNIIFFGASGGANIVLGACLRLLDNGDKLPKGLLVPYPMIDDRNDSFSKTEFSSNKIWSKENNDLAWNYYKYGLSNQNSFSDSYTVISRRKNFKGFPQVMTFVGELDLFKDETIELVNQLSKSQIPVEFRLFRGCCHGFDKALPNASVSKKCIKQMKEFVEEVFNKTK